MKRSSDCIAPCPICSKQFTPPIRLCSRGHSICDTCAKEKVNCFLCESKMTHTRNYALEDALFLFEGKDIPYYIKNKAEMQSTEKCPVCEDSIDKALIEEHFSSCHTDVKFDNWNNNIDIFDFHFTADCDRNNDIKCGIIWIYVIGFLPSCNFFLRLSFFTTEGDLYITIRCTQENIAPLKLRLKLKTDKSKYTWTGRPAHVPTSLVPTIIIPYQEISKKSIGVELSVRRPSG